MASSMTRSLEYPSTSSLHGHGDHKTKIRERLVLKNGEWNVILKNLKKPRLDTFLRMLVTMEWKWTLFVLLVLYVFAWIHFACVWWLVAYARGDIVERHTKMPCVQNMKSFQDSLLFSLETQTGIGYGNRVIYHCPEAIIIIVFQALAGHLLHALIVGIVVTKISRSKYEACNLKFSHYAVVCVRDGIFYLLVRVANIGREDLIGVQATGLLVKDRTTIEEEYIHHQQKRLSFRTELPWPITLVHKMDSKSPLYHYSPFGLGRGDIEVIVTLSAYIEHTSKKMEVRYSYLSPNIIWGYRFSPLLTNVRNEGAYEMDYESFGSVQKMKMPHCSAREADLRARHMRFNEPKYPGRFRNF